MKLLSKKGECFSVGGTVYKLMPLMLSLRLYEIIVIVPLKSPVGVSTILRPLIGISKRFPPISLIPSFVMSKAFYMMTNVIK